MEKMSRSEVYAIILAGGQSSRLFPFNKVLADLTGSGRSLIQQAYDRLDALPRENIFLLTVRDMVAPIRRQLKVSPKHIFVDPVGRGTWPAILWAMAQLRRQDATAVMAIVTGDHVIQGDRAFQQAFRQAVDIAQSKPAIVMMGIPPRGDPQAWRGFGCFRADEDGCVIEFQEKPTFERAQQMIQAGGWLWNSGMFFFRIPTAEAALRRLQPEMHRVYAAMAAAVAANKGREAARLYEDFPDKIPHPRDPGRYVDNSIDYAIMTPLVHCSPHPTPSPRGEGKVRGIGAFAVQNARFRWTDLGQWTALRQVLKADRNGNIRIGDVRVGQDVRHSILVAGHGQRIDVAGIKDLIVAVAQGQALVLPLSEVGRIKEIVGSSRGKSGLIGEMPSISSFTLSKKRNGAILSNKLKEAI